MDYERYDGLATSSIFKPCDGCPYFSSICNQNLKSGKATYELDKFWSSYAGKAQRVLEASVLACVCVNMVTKQCFALEATQTPAAVTQREVRGYSRLSFYATGRPA